MLFVQTATFATWHKGYHKSPSKHLTWGCFRESKKKIEHLWCLGICEEDGNVNNDVFGGVPPWRAESFALAQTNALLCGVLLFFFCCSSHFGCDIRPFCVMDEACVRRGQELCAEAPKVSYPCPSRTISKMLLGEGIEFWSVLDYHHSSQWVRRKRSKLVPDRIGPMQRQRVCLSSDAKFCSQGRPPWNV